MRKHIALVGDYNQNVVAHVAIPHALELACLASGVDVNWSWVATTTITNATKDFADFAAIWVVPASPYANMDGALDAIRFARETGRPLLGTCGGFQHMLIEYARNVGGIGNADHAEINPENTNLIVTPLVCSLVGESGDISFTSSSLLHTIFKKQPTHESYHCNYGLNPEWLHRLETAGLRFTGFDNIGNVRACELPSHPFFIGTLFQPERSALQEKHHPLITAFVGAASNI